MADGWTGNAAPAGEKRANVERGSSVEGAAGAPGDDGGRPCDGEGLVRPIVIAVGAGARGAGTKRAIGDLAERLGAVVVGTRPAMDAGLIEREQMVGQTGIRCVDADVYLALGISGSSQHQSSLKRVGTLVAINRDERAPIMRDADVAIVADVEPAVQALCRALDAADEAHARGSGRGSRTGGAVNPEQLVACCVAMAHGARLHAQQRNPRGMELPSRIDKGSGDEQLLSRQR